MQISGTVANHLVDEATKSENERCAKIADSFAIQGLRYKNPGEMALAIAAAIRSSRSQ